MFILQQQKFELVQEKVNDDIPFKDTVTERLVNGAQQFIKWQPPHSAPSQQPSFQIGCLEFFFLFSTVYAGGHIQRVYLTALCVANPTVSIDVAWLRLTGDWRHSAETVSPDPGTQRDSLGAAVLKRVTSETQSFSLVLPGNCFQVRLCCVKRGGSIPPSLQPDWS